MFVSSTSGEPETKAERIYVLCRARVGDLSWVSVWINLDAAPAQVLLGNTNICRDAALTYALLG